MPTNGIFDGPVTSLLSKLCILIEVLSCAHAKGEKALMTSNLALLLVFFQSDSERVKSKRNCLKTFSQKQIVMHFAPFPIFLQIEHLTILIILYQTKNIKEYNNGICLCTTFEFLFLGPS